MSPDPFDVLGLPATFDLDRGQVERAYFAQSAVLHPDLASGDEEAQRRMAVINHARRVLEDPERRADALLLRLGGPSREQHKALPPAFLMEMMEIREAVEAAGAEADPEARASQRRSWEAWAEAERQKAIGEVAGMFRALAEWPSEGQREEIRTRLNAWRYIERLIEQLDPGYNPGRADHEG
jgi:molecular chaperone HscB